MVRPQSSAAGVLALLQEPDPIFKQHALKALNPLVPQFWAEISEHIALMYALAVNITISSDINVYDTVRPFTKVTNFLKLPEMPQP